MAVSGNLKDLSLVDMIQIYKADKKDVVINLGSDLGFGRVFMEKGEIVHSTYQDLVGKEALYKLITWDEGEFEVLFDAAITDRTITDESVQSILLDGMRILDEARERGETGSERSGDLETLMLVDRLLSLGILIRTPHHDYYNE